MTDIERSTNTTTFKMLYPRHVPLRKETSKVCPTEIELISRKLFIYEIENMVNGCSIRNLFLHLPLPLTKVAAKERVTPARSSLVKKSEIIGLLS